MDTPETLAQDRKNTHYTENKKDEQHGFQQQTGGEHMR